jgi:hypothetical protein
VDFEKTQELAFAPIRLDRDDFPRWCHCV